MDIAVTAPTIPTDLAAEVANLQLELEQLTEATSDARRLLAFDEAGWTRLGDDGTLPWEYVQQETRKARIMVIVDPLIRRGVHLRIAYTWGASVDISAADGGETGQDVNAVVQAFLDDPSNQATFTTGQAHERLERGLATDGEKFLALATTPATGRVEVRHIPTDQIDDIITNPEDVEDPWLYRRTYTTKRVVATGIATTQTREETRTVFYPAVGYRPNRRARTIDGHEVQWDTPVLHVAVNRPEGSLRGTPDVLAALPWAQGYREFLEDWARLVKALSRFAFQATAKNGRGAGQVRGKIAAGAADGPVGQTVITPEGQKFEAIGKSGATIDSRSGFPLAAQTAAALDVPATMLTADPGVTGARATAETLDRPLELVIGMRRDLWIGAFRTVLGYVIDCAVRAGRLNGTRTIDPYTGRETVRLANDQATGIQVDFPDLSEVDIETLMGAIKTADELGKLPPLLIARMALQALRVDDIDAAMEELTGEDGQFLDPNLRADQAAAAAAIRALRNGQDPAAVLR